MCFPTVKTKQGSSVKSCTCPGTSATAPPCEPFVAGSQEALVSGMLRVTTNTPCLMAPMLLYSVGTPRTPLTLGEVRLQVLPRLIQDVGHLDSHGQDVISSWPKQVTVFQKSLCTLVAHKIWEAEKLAAPTWLPHRLSGADSHYSPSPLGPKVTPLHPLRQTQTSRALIPSSPLSLAYHKGQMRPCLTLQPLLSFLPSPGCRPPRGWKGSSPSAPQWSPQSCLCSPR